MRAITLGESDDDLLGPMKFALVVEQVDQGSVSLEVRANQAGKIVWFWRGHLVFDRYGKAVLPFWNYRLVFTRGTMAAKVAFTPDGDGSGWEAAKLVEGAPTS